VGPSCDGDSLHGPTPRIGGIGAGNGVELLVCARQLKRFSSFKIGLSKKEYESAAIEMLIGDPIANRARSLNPSIDIDR